MQRTLDLQGSTRAMMNNNAGSGTSTIIARHDYLPFGEEIGANVGLRTDGQGYSTNPWAKDRVRQRYGLTERDDVTGLDHTWWRKYESFSGRMTTPDPYGGSVAIGNPQSFNRYSYVQNDPVNFVDPSGLDFCWGGTLISDPWNVPEQPGFEVWRCTSSKTGGAPGGGGPDGGHGGGGGSNAGTRFPQNRMPREVEAEACVTSVVAHYLGHEALTLLKQAALNAGLGLAAYVATIFLGEAAAAIEATSFIDIAIEGGIKVDHFFRGVIIVGLAARYGGKQYLKLVKESFNNKKEAFRALKACFA